MKQKLCFLLLLCPFFWGFGQDTNISYANTPIKIGDKVPDMVIGPVINSPSNSLRISDFKGKLLILDFWATSCSSCIAALPRLDSLQKEYGDKLAIVTISYEKAATVQSFLKHNPIGKNIHLPIATDDTKLSALFPHRMLSHEVWIDGNSKVRAITEAEYVNKGNIEAMLKNTSFTLPLKSDIEAYDYRKPLFSGNAAFYSMVTAYKPGVAPRFGVTTDSVQHTVRIWIVNFPILSMYMLATDNLLYFPKTLMDIRVKDSAFVRVPSGKYRDAWKPDHYFSYESVLPGNTSAGKIKQAMLSDLNKFFRLNGRMEKEKVKCLVLERLNGNTLLPATIGGIPMNTLHRTDTLRVLKNATLSNIIWELNEIPGGLPAVDDTGFSGNVDMELPVSSFRDIAEVNKALRLYGLILQQDHRELEFFVLTDALTE